MVGCHPRKFVGKGKWSASARSPRESPIHLEVSLLAGSCLDLGYPSSLDLRKDIKSYAMIRKRFYVSKIRGRAHEETSIGKSYYAKMLSWSSCHMRTSHPQF